MLVLTRYQGQKIRIGNDIVLQVGRVSEDEVEIRIIALNPTHVDGQELFDSGLEGLLPDVSSLSTDQKWQPKQATYLRRRPRKPSHKTPTEE